MTFKKLFIPISICFLAQTAFSFSERFHNKNPQVNPQSTSQNRDQSLTPSLDLNTLSQGTGLAFEDTKVGDTRLMKVTLRNQGRSSVDTLEGSILESPFAYSGRLPFPGDRGTCGLAPLKPNETCTVQLEFSPLYSDTFSMDWQLTYQIGKQVAVVTVPLAGTTPLPAELIITSEEPIVFPATAIGDQSTTIVSIENVGGQNAENIKPPLLGSPFNYTGYTYPGLNGTCGESLKVAESCVLELSFEPKKTGVNSSAATMPYETLGEPSELFLFFSGQGI